MSTPVRRRTALAAAGLLLAAPLLAGCTGGSDGDDGSPRTGAVTLPAPLPDLELPVLGEDGTANLSDVQRPTLVNVWATWCAPCRKEMPLLQEFAEKYAGVVDVLGVNFQDPQSELAVKFADEAGVTYRSLRDVDGKINRLAPFPELRGLPFMAVVDGDGQVVGAEFSVAHDLEDLESLVTEHLPGALEGTS